MGLLSNVLGKVTGGGGKKSSPKPEPSQPQGALSRGMSHIEKAFKLTGKNGVKTSTSSSASLTD